MAGAKPPSKPKAGRVKPDAAAPDAAAPDNATLTADSVAELVGCAAEDILVWRDYGDQVVVVTRDGQKLTGQVAEAVLAGILLPGESSQNE